MVDLNATQAAIRAGYSEKTATKIASENLTKPDIQKYIEQLQRELRETTKITQRELLGELKAIGFAKIDNQNVKASDKLKAIEIMAEMLGYDKPDADNDGGYVRELLEEFRKV